MASGFFLGGAAEGMQNASELALKRDNLTADTLLRQRGLDLQEKQIGQTGSLQSRALDLQEQSQKNSQQRELLTRADTQIDATMSVVSETIKAGLAAGKDPVEINKAVAPLVQSAKSLAAKAGRDPLALDNRVIAELTLPTGAQVGAGEGAKSAAKIAAEDKGLTQAGVDPNRFKEHKDKVTAEGALRDDYVKQAKDFTTVRDFKDRMDSAPKTGAGDISLVFSYMKLLDPSSTVREGEYATAANAGGAYATAGNLYNKVITGEQLPEKARKEIREASQKIFTTAAERHNNMTKQFESIAKRQGLNPKNVIVDFEQKRPDPLGIR